MTKEYDCEYEQRVRNLALKGGYDKEIEQHIASCSECSESIRVFSWMQSFAGQTSKPQNLPSPGFLLFRARLLAKQSAAKRAVRPIAWMKFAALGILILALFYLQTNSGFPLGSTIGKALASFAVIAPLAILAVIGAVLFCLVAAHFFRDTKTKKRGTD